MKQHNILACIVKYALIILMIGVIVGPLGYLLWEFINTIHKTPWLEIIGNVGLALCILVLMFCFLATLYTIVEGLDKLWDWANDNC